MKKLYKILFPVLGATSLLLGFFIPFTIQQVQNNGEKTLSISKEIEKELTSGTSTQSNKANEYWKLSNSYSIEFDSKQSLKMTIREALKLPEKYDIKICEYGQKVDGPFSDINENFVNPYTPQIVYKFRYVIGRGQHIYDQRDVNNIWMLNDALKGTEKISYFDIFGIDAKFSKDVQTGIQNSASAFLTNNKDLIAKNIADNNLGDDKDIKKLFKFAGRSFSIDYDNKTFSFNNPDMRELFKEIVSLDYPEGYKGINSFDDTAAYQYFIRQDLNGKRYFHDLLGLTKSDTPVKAFNPNKEFTADTTLAQVKDEVNRFLSMTVLHAANLDSILEEGNTPELFDIKLGKSYNPKSGFYSDDQTIAKLWGFSGGVPYFWVHFTGLSDEGKKIKPLLSINSNFDEQVQFELALTNKDGDK